MVYKNPDGKDQLVWRGVAEDVIDDKATTHEEKQEYLNHLVQQTLADFPPPSK